MRQNNKLLLPALFLVALIMGTWMATEAFARNDDPGEKTERNGDDINQILTKLPNGLTVYIIRDARFPIVCSRLYVRAGSANEKASEAGISHLLEHMVFKGTSHRPKGKVARDVEALGGYLNAATSFDRTWYITDLPAEAWRTGMEVAKDMAFQATLDPAELQAEKDVVISELQRGEDSPMRKLYENLQTSALKNTPYGRPIIGYEKTVRSITADDLRAYVRRWYQPQNMMALVAGDINPEEVLEYAKNLYGKLENSVDLPIYEPLDLANASAGSARAEVSRGPWNKVYLGVAFAVPGYEDVRSVSLDMLAYLLGGDGTSELYKKYKYEKRLVDSIDAGNMSMARAGLFTITVVLDADKVETFWQELTADLGKLSQKEFAPEAIERARFNLEDSMDRAGETLNGLASWRGMVQLDLGGEQGEENLRYAQKNIDEAELREAVKNWLTPERARIRVLAPENAALPDFIAAMDANWQGEAANSVARVKGKRSATEIIRLENGCRVILEPDASAPYVAMDLLMAGGNAMLKPERQGLANLVARLLSDGCGDLDAPAVERWFADRAASGGARAGLQTFGLSMTGPSRFNDDYFVMFRDMMKRPRFEPEELAREVENMKADINQRNESPFALLRAKIQPFLFPDHQPYGYDPLGTDKILDSFTANDAREFWAAQSAQPWVLAVAGDFNKEKILEFANSLPQPQAAAFVAPEPRWEEKARTLDLMLPGRNQAHFMRIFKTVPLGHPDAPALELLQSAISGQSGVLFTRLRDDEGLGYSISAFNRFMPLTGYMAFYVGSTPEKLERAREGFNEIIEKLKTEPLPEADVKIGANRLWGEYLRSGQSFTSRAVEAATDEILNHPQNFQRIIVEKARTLSPADVLRVAQKYLVDSYDVVLLP